MKTIQKNLLMNLLRYWSDHYNTTFGRDITWDAPVKTSPNTWCVDVYEEGDSANHFELIAKIYKTINVSCFMDGNGNRFRYHIF